MTIKSTIRTKWRYRLIIYIKGASMPSIALLAVFFVMAFWALSIGLEEIAVGVSKR